MAGEKEIVFGWAHTSELFVAFSPGYDSSSYSMPKKTNTGRFRDDAQDSHVCYRSPPHGGAFSAAGQYCARPGLRAYATVVHLPQALEPYRVADFGLSCNRDLDRHRIPPRAGTRRARTTVDRRGRHSWKRCGIYCRGGIAVEFRGD